MRFVLFNYIISTIMSRKLELASMIIPPEVDCLPEGIKREREAFLETRVKFALQKDGELTDLSANILRRAARIDDSHVIKPEGRKLFKIIDDVGLIFVRNRSICQLVASGSVDFGIVGLDQVIESGLSDKIVVVSEFRDLAEWDIVLATLSDVLHRSIEDIAVVASQYPVIASTFFNSIGSKAKIIPIHGSAEVMPLLEYCGQPIDGIVDLRSSGKTLAENGLLAWEPAITTVFPVLFANPKTINDSEKMSYLRDELFSG